MYSDWDQDEEDEKGPDDLNQQLDLRKEDKKEWWHTLIKQIQEEWIKTSDKFCSFCIFFSSNKVIVIALEMMCVYVCEEGVVSCCLLLTVIPPWVWEEYMG